MCRFNSGPRRYSVLAAAQGAAGNRTVLSLKSQEDRLGSTFYAYIIG
jgi:hypothetical protein